MRKGNDPIFDMFVFETTELTGQLEEIALNSEKNQGIGSSIDEIFRVMHTIKGSSAMMRIVTISGLAHSLENLFHYIREHRELDLDDGTLYDLILGSVDFIKDEIVKLEDGRDADGDNSELMARIEDYLHCLESGKGEAKPCGQREQAPAPQAAFDDEDDAYEATIFFDEGCEMENIRAFEITHRLKDVAEDMSYVPADIMDSDKSVEVIREKGFSIRFRSDLPPEQLRELLLETMFIKELTFGKGSGQAAAAAPDTAEIREDAPAQKAGDAAPRDKQPEAEDRSESAPASGKSGTPAAHKQSMISVSTGKLDTLMDLVGELVISQAMVLQNPEFKRLSLEGLRKDASQLEKITGELRDIVMAIRMVPLSVTFQRMHRIVRDMSIKLNKKVELQIIGEQTEVDKNIIEQISDPLMHIIRNSVDHGLETPAERLAAGKSETGVIVLEAKNAGGDVWITVKDDGKGLNRDKILAKARREGLIDDNQSEMSDKDVWSLIFKPGFSTNESVSEFSGRGVGMDVVNRNIQQLGGTVIAESVPGKETVIAIKIPLTLAIIDGMLIKVGKTIYTIPTVCVKEFFRADREEVITDTNGNEMMMIRKKCHPLIRLHGVFGAGAQEQRDQAGIVIMVEYEGKSLCLLADELLGQQQVVIKSLPEYLKKVKGISGCTLLGDGTISLIIDISTLTNQ